MEHTRTVNVTPGDLHRDGSICRCRRRDWGQRQCRRRTCLRFVFFCHQLRSQCSAAAHVDEFADDEPHDPDSEPEEDTTEANPQDPHEQEESNRDFDSNLFFDGVPKDESEDEVEPWVDYICATHKADDFLTTGGITSWTLGRSRLYWKQARMTALHHDDKDGSRHGSSISWS